MNDIKKLTSLAVVASLSNIATAKTLMRESEATLGMYDRAEHSRKQANGTVYTETRSVPSERHACTVVTLNGKQSDQRTKKRTKEK